MSKVNSYTLDKVLNNIDAFVDGRPAEISDIQPYITLVNEYPFTSGKLRAKIANKFVFLPLKTIKKSFQNYFYQKDRELMLIQQKMTVLEEKMDYMQKILSKVADDVSTSSSNSRKGK